MSEPRQERKVVTVVFCDLVGFTRQAESLDPEDVAAILRPYHARVRTELERYGGTVEKFIGDAVMALFGAPVAHEDDPERAVRAALAIRDFAIENELELRVGITTGEALVQLDAQPDAGEGMASGDVVNTAARLQSGAPINGVLVDETTYRATRTAVDFEDAEPVEAKGKAEPVAVWHALTAHSRFGVDVAHEARAALVGRDRELSVLRDAFERARHERVPQLVTLVGVPGLGKSRLVYELSRIADADAELVTWRQGRCLAYGDGVTLWALAEIVKAQAGIAEQDTSVITREKIHKVVEETLAGTGDEAWVESHLHPLVGLEEESELASDRSGEAFAAWRRFLEGMAEQRTLVVVFEDLHWADESLLDFVDELVDWVADAPLLVVATARPELLERRPGWGGGKLNATTLALAPLDDEQTAVLIAQLLSRPMLPVEDQKTLLERAGGNPLYAEQFADLFLERGSTDELSLPETLQGIIAARIDGLPAAEKELLQDAAVVGKVFWASALQGATDDARENLHSLERKGFVRRQKRTSVEGQQELAFAHALVRDVSYGQIARADRAAKHRQVAEWIEALGRPDDHAEMLAYHWRSSLELARAASRETPELVDATRLALRNAGDRAYSLNAYGQAEAYYAEALALWQPGGADWADLLFRRGLALHIAGDDRQEHVLEEARDALLASGDRESAAEAEAYLSRALWFRGRLADVHARLDHAEELVAGVELSIAKARVLCLSARLRMLASEHEEAIRIATQALMQANELALDELRIHALTTLGTARGWLQDQGAATDFDEALAIAGATDSPLTASVLNNVAVIASQDGDLARGRELFEEMQIVAQKTGDGENVRFARGNLLYYYVFDGRWDEGLKETDRFIAECQVSPHYLESSARGIRAYMRLGRGDGAGASDDLERALALTSPISEEPGRRFEVLIRVAHCSALLGRETPAREAIAELLELARTTPAMAHALDQIAGVSRRLGMSETVRVVLELARDGPWKEAAVAQADGEFLRAAEIYARMPEAAGEAEARLRAAEELLEAGRRGDGEAEIEKALGFYRSVGATFFIQRCERLLADAQSASA